VAPHLSPEANAIHPNPPAGCLRPFRQGRGGQGRDQLAHIRIHLPARLLIKRAPFAASTFRKSGMNQDRQQEQVEQDRKSDSRQGH
jgi:hypothetical protein